MGADVETKAFDIEIGISMDSNICGFLVYFLDTKKKKKKSFCWTSLTSSVLRGRLFVPFRKPESPPTRACTDGRGSDR